MEGRLEDFCEGKREKNLSRYGRETGEAPVKILEELDSCMGGPSKRPRSGRRILLLRSRAGWGTGKKG